MDAVLRTSHQGHPESIHVASKDSPLPHKCFSAVRKRSRASFVNAWYFPSSNSEFTTQRSPIPSDVFLEFLDKFLYAAINRSCMAIEAFRAHSIMHRLGATTNTLTAASLFFNTC